MRERAVVGFGEQAGRSDQFTSKMKVTFCAGDEAAPARSPKPPRRCGEGGVLLACAAAGFQEVEKFLDEVDNHGCHGKGSAVG